MSLLSTCSNCGKEEESFYDLWKCDEFDRDICDDRYYGADPKRAYRYICRQCYNNR